jgi:hypothetical protein
MATRPYAYVRDEFRKRGTTSSPSDNRRGEPSSGFGAVGLVAELQK